MHLDVSFSIEIFASLFKLVKAQWNELYCLEIELENVICAVRWVTIVHSSHLEAMK